jgi:hypothetical protein
MKSKSASAAKKESKIALFALKEQRSRPARAETVGQGQVTIVERITGLSVMQIGSVRRI